MGSLLYIWYMWYIHIKCRNIIGMVLKRCIMNNFKKGKSEWKILEKQSVPDGVTIGCVVWSGWAWAWSSATWPNRWPANPWAGQGGTQPRSYRGPWGPAAGRSWGGPRQGKFTRWGWSVSPQCVIFLSTLFIFIIFILILFLI